MKFYKFPSIENSYRDTWIEMIREKGMAADYRSWVVQEKIHGMNASIMCDGTQILFGTRNDFRNENEVPVCHVADDMKECVTNLYHILKKKGTLFDCVIVYGEIFGGSYNHPEVQKYSRVSKVQKGVDYIPGVSFYAFDILLVTDWTKEPYFLNTVICESLFDQSGFFFAKTLFEGNLDDCLKYPNDNPTTIPKQFGLPEIEGNVMEGVVIKPVVPAFIGDHRVILKNKNDKFKEKQQESNKEKQNQDFSLSEEEQELVNEALHLVNYNRFKSVLSKIPESTTEEFWDNKANIGRLMKESVSDAMEEFSKDREAGSYDERFIRGFVTKAFQPIILAKFK